MFLTGFVFSAIRHRKYIEFETIEKDFENHHTLMRKKIKNIVSQREQAEQEFTGWRFEVRDNGKKVEIEEEPKSPQTGGDQSAKYPSAFIAIEYRSEVADAWSQMQKLPELYRDQFLVALDSDPKQDQDSLTKLVNRLFGSHEKVLNPYEDGAANEALAEAREISADAEAEFKRVYDMLGGKLSPEDILQQVHNKYWKPDPKKEFGYKGRRVRTDAHHYLYDGKMFETEEDAKFYIDTLIGGLTVATRRQELRERAERQRLERAERRRLSDDD